MPRHQQQIDGEEGEIVNPTQWFAEHLSSTGEGFAWAVDQVPPARRALPPPPKLGEWSAVRHVFHLAYYERTIALPSMQQWLAGARPDEEQMDEDAAWAANMAGLEALLAAHRRARAEQIALLPELHEADWQSARDTIWGPMPLLWVVTKTYQHTAEHINDVLRIALFWDFYSEEQR